MRAIRWQTLLWAGIAIVLIGCASSCMWAKRGMVSFFSVDVEPNSPAVENPLSKSNEATSSQPLRLARVASGFGNITDIQFVPRAKHQLVVLEKNGRAHSLKIRHSESSWAVDSQAQLFQVQVATDSELGLLGLAFHPNFDVRSAVNNRFFVHYNPRSDLSRISEWEWRDNRAVEKRVIFETAQPYQNHNGGCLAFGPDGKLYAGFGDGGWRGDPQNHAQDKKSLLGKMLRFDVDKKLNGRITPEIFASGLRNPWRFSFDSKGRLIAGDVGQDEWEEITFVPEGANLGWRVMEASHCYDPAKGCESQADDFIGPFAEYDHSLGKSVTGGYEYTGKTLPDAAGRYFFGDFVSGRIWSVPLPNKNPKRPVSSAGMTLHGQWDILISTFARDSDGELYLGDYRSGAVYRLMPQ